MTTLTVDTWWMTHRRLKALARQPEPVEVQSALRFLEQAAEDKGAQLTPWQQYAQVLLETNEFLFLD